MLKYDRLYIDGQVFKFVYGCALRDAILQKAFSAEKKDWVKDVSAAETTVCGFVSRILDGKYAAADEDTKREYEKDFIKTASELCDAVNNYSEKPSGVYIGKFAFGNAQKLINMTVKHIYAHTYTVHRLNGDGAESVRDAFRHCHCPMDSIMLGKVFRKYGELFGSKARRETLGKSEEFCKAWGKEDFLYRGSEPLPSKRYASFQTAIANIIKKSGGTVYPIEYDYIVWQPDLKEQG